MNCCTGMTRFFGVLAVLALGTLLGSFMSQGNLAVGDEEVVKNDGKLLRHVVMFQFKESSSESDINGVVEAFRQLPQKIDTIADFEYGTDNSPEGLADGFTHCFLVSFKSEKDREVYLPHKAHQEFVEILKPHLEKVMVIDYWAKP